MANISNLKINERSNVEWPNLRVTTIENENWKVLYQSEIEIKMKIETFISKGKYENRQNCD